MIPPPKILTFVPPHPPSSGGPAKHSPRGLLNPGTETLGLAKSNTPRDPVAAAMSCTTLIALSPRVIAVFAVSKISWTGTPTLSVVPLPITHSLEARSNSGAISLHPSLSPNPKIASAVLLKKLRGLNPIKILSNPPINGCKNLVTPPII